MASDRVEWNVWPVAVYSMQTTVATAASLLTVWLFRLPQACALAPVATIVITQSSLDAALSVSLQRHIGTALGAGSRRNSW